MLGAAPAGAVSLEQAVRSALRTSPDVGIVLENRRATNEELEQAEGRFLPTLDLRTTGGFESTNDVTTRGRAKAPNDGSSVRMPHYESSLTLRQLLFDGFAAAAEVDRQEARVRSAARRVLETTELTAQDAVEAYLESLRHRELVALAQDNVRVHEEHLRQVKLKAEGGAAGSGDVQQAESRLALARDTLAQAEGRLRDADATYTRVIGEFPRNPSRPRPPVEALPTGLDAAIGLALDYNPTVRVARADTKVAAAELEATHAKFMPRFDLELSANSNRNLDGVRGQDSSLSALVVMSYNLFQGGIDVHRRREFLARLAESRQRLNRAVRVVEERVRLAWNALLSARQRLKALRAQVQANERVRIAYRQQFDIGQRSLLDLLDSENELFIARNNAVSAEFVEMFGVYRVLSAVGMLLTALDIQPPKEAFMQGERIDRTDGKLRHLIRTAPALDPTTPGGSMPPLAAPPDLGQPGLNAPVLDPTVPVLDPTAPPTAVPAAPPGVDLTTPPGGDLMAPPTKGEAPVLDPMAPPAPTAAAPGHAAGDLPITETAGHGSGNSGESGAGLSPFFGVQPPNLGQSPDGPEYLAPEPAPLPRRRPGLPEIREASRATIPATLAYGAAVPVRGSMQSPSQIADGVGGSQKGTVQAALPLWGFD